MRKQGSRLITAVVVIWGSLIYPSQVARAEGFHPRLGASAAFFANHFLDESNRQRFGFGFGVGMLFDFRPIPSLGLQLGANGSWISKRNASASTDYVGGQLGLRLHILELPGLRDRAFILGHDAWVDMHYALGSSGGVTRNGFDAGIGYGFPLTRDRQWNLGPFLRYQWFDGRGQRTPSILMLGLSVDLPGWFPAGRGRRYRRSGEETNAIQPSTPPPNGRDMDGDGIPDAQDACPRAAGPAQSPLAEPDPRQITSTTFATSKKGATAPKVTAPGATAPEARSSIPQSKSPVGRASQPLHTLSRRPGCPVEDADEDGIEDTQDACPTRHFGLRSDAKRTGCPIVDEDADTVPDDEDACPRESGSPSTDPSMRGCPGAIRIEEGKIIPQAALHFEPGTAQLSEEGYLWVDAVADAIEASPWITGFVLEYHTETQIDGNGKLVSMRMRTLRNELSDRGVPAHKIFLEHAVLDAYRRTMFTPGSKQNTGFFVLPVFVE